MQRSSNNDIPKIHYVKFLLRNVLFAEKNFFGVIITYGIFIAFLSLAVPLSVQLLINSVAFTALLQPIIVLGIALLALLSFSSVLNGMQYITCEIFQRRFFARMSAEITNQLLRISHKDFQEINQTAFTNQFFEVFTIQKTVPKILTKTVALILQIITGLILVAFYHPILLVFSLIIIVCLYLIWRIYSKHALVTKFASSSKKYEMAEWLEDIAQNYVFFKSSSAQKYARSKTNLLTEKYLFERKRHFTELFSQVVLTLILYSVASATLLLIGGYLVINGQLSTGQLVASELVLSASFYGISQLGKDLDDFYDLIAACQKISNFYEIPYETDGNQFLQNKDFGIEFKNVYDVYRGREFIFNLLLEPHKNYIISSNDLVVQKLIIELITGLRKPNRGSLFLQKTNVEDAKLEDIHSKISVIDNSPFIGTTLIEFLTLNDREISRKRLNEVLHITGLEDVISKHKDGLLLKIMPSGWPFSESEKILLKTARTLLQEPEVIIITEVLDMLQLRMRKKILNFLTKDHGAMVLYFSNRRDDMMEFDSYLFLSQTNIRQFNTLAELDNFEKQHG